MAITGVDHIRRVNLSQVLRALHTVGPLSRSELGTRLGLTRSTTALLVADLVGRGLAIEGDAVRLGTPGRPSPVLHPNESGVAVLVVQVAVNSMVVALVGLGGGVLSLVRTPRDPRRFDPQDTVRDLATMLQDLRAKAPVGCRLAGVGIGVCGVVRHSDGLVIVAPNIGWRDVPLGDLLAPLLPSEVPIAIFNDIDAAALGEYARGAGKRVIKNLAYVGGEIGVGGGIIVGGRLLRGASTSAAEIGHWPLNPQGGRCRCGGVGCWETEAGDEALLRAAGLPVEPPYPPAVERVIEAAKQRDPQAESAVQRVGYWMGVGLAGVASTFAPELIVLGGVFGDLFPLVEDQVRDLVRSRSLLPEDAQPVIVPSGLGVRATPLGIAELAFDPLLARPSAFDLVPVASIGAQKTVPPRGEHGQGVATSTAS